MLAAQVPGRDVAAEAQPRERQPRTKRCTSCLAERNSRRAKNNLKKVIVMS